MIKHSITLLLGGFLVAGSALSLIGCSERRFDSRFWEITDSGLITDRSFNENVYQGLTDYTQKVNNNKNIYGSYIEPVNTTTSTLINSFKVTQTLGAKITVLSGFRFLAIEKQASNILDKVIQVDGTVGDDTSKSLPNVAFLTYASEISGFWGAIADAEYFGNAVPDSAIKIPRFAIYGGLPNANSVNNYLWGFLAGMSFWNYVISNPDSQKNKQGVFWRKTFNEVSNIWSKKSEDGVSPVGTLRPVDLTNTTQGKLDSNGQFTKFSISNQPVPPHWFSGGFSSPGGKSISDTFFAGKGDNLANSVFAVAGGQTLDTINAMKSYSGGDLKYDRLIGVDTNQGAVYGGDYIISSALKRLRASTEKALTEVRNETPGAPGNKFLGHTLTSGNPDYYKWAGISPTSLTSGNKHARLTLDMINLIQYGHGVGDKIPTSFTTGADELIGALVSTFNKAIAISNPNDWFAAVENTQKFTNNNWGKYLAQEVSKSPSSGKE